MPSSIADPLYERLIRAFPDDRAYTPEDWSDDPMPEPIRHFLSQLLRHQSRIEAERLREARSRWVDYDHPDVERAVRTFFAAVEDHMRVPKSEWPDTLHQATRHVSSYLVRPTHVLGEFVFDDRDGPLPIDQVMWRMKFFGPYAYLRDAVQAYVRQRDDDRLTRPVFETFLRRIDERITSEYDADRWLRLLGPLFRVVRTATERSAAPVGALTVFFREKGATDLADALQDSAEGDAIDPKALHSLLRRELGEPAPPPSSQPQPDRPQQRRSQSGSSPQPPSQSSPSPQSSSQSSSSQTSSSQEERSQQERSQQERSQQESSERAAPASYSMEEISRSSRDRPAPSGQSSSSQSSGGQSSSNSSSSGQPSRSQPSARQDTSGQPSHDTSSQSTSSPDASGDSSSSRSSQAPPTSREAPPTPDGYDELSDEDRGEIWGVEGSAREVRDGDETASGAGASASPASEPPAQNPSSPPSPDAASGQNASGAGASDDGSVPLWKQFQQGRTRSSQDASRSGNGSNGGGAGGNETPLWARFKTDRERRGEDLGDAPSGPPSSASPSGASQPASSQSGSPSPGSSAPGSSASASPASGSAPSASGPASDGDVQALERSVLGESNPPQRAVYVRQLFGGSMDHYASVLQRLAGAGSWSEASQIIAQDVFRRNKVNIYSDAAVQFTNAVESRYR